MSSGVTGVTVVITPPPTPNGPLHVGHLSGPYVAGDVAVRAARARGERVLSVSGLDVHQNYVLAAAEAEGRPVAEVAADYGDRIRSAFALAGVSYDLFLDPADDPDYRDAVGPAARRVAVHRRGSRRARCPGRSARTAAATCITPGWRGHAGCAGNRPRAAPARAARPTRPRPTWSTRPARPAAARPGSSRGRFRCCGWKISARS